MAEHDVIVVGGGHNGLVAGAYLARGGMDVLVLEARSTTGGCASTVEALGARVNICNCDHVLVRSTPIPAELELASHGLRYLDLEPHTANVTWDGDGGWFGFHDLDRTLASLAVDHPDQVDGYRRWIEDAVPVVDLVLAMTNEVPDAATTLRRVLERRGAGVTRMLRWSRMSAEAVLRSYLSAESVLSPMLATAPTVWGLPPDAPGTGLAAVSFAMRHRVQPGRPVGGSGAFPDAVRASFEAAGGTVVCDSPVDRILVSGRRVHGVRVEGGAVHEAPIVVAAVDPYRVFVEWVDGSVRERSRWLARRDRHGYESKIDAVVAGTPRTTRIDGASHGVEDPLVPTVIVAPPSVELAENHRLLQQGKVGRRPVMYVNVPSVLDARMRPEGGHVVSLEVLYTPYELDGGWEGSEEPRRWLRLAGTVLGPGFEASVRAWRHVGPCQYESDFRMRNGYATSFAGGPLAVLAGRDRELTRYRTSIEGLYLTGAATFPGAGVWGAPGRNTARAVLARAG